METGVPISFLGLCGLSPQVLSETLWALRQRGDVIQAIHIISTLTGAEAFHRILGYNGERLKALWPQGEMPPVDMEIMARHDGRPVRDIITAEDHLAVLKVIGSKVQALTAEGMIPLHASAAGGRKTMSSILSIAMNIYGRPQDNLSHVLVDPAVEGRADFLYPGQQEPDEDKVQLVDLPFPRLGILLNREMRQMPLEKLTEVIARRLSHLELVVLCLRSRELMIGSRSVKLRPVGAAIYLYLIRIQDTDREGVNPQNLDVGLMAQCYRDVGASHQKAAMLQVRLDNENPQGWFLEHLARIRSALNQALGPTLAAEGGVDAVGKRPHTRYRLRLPASRIRIQHLDV